MASFEVVKSIKSLKSENSNGGDGNVANVLQDKALIEDKEDDNFWFWGKQLLGFLDDKSVIFASFANKRFNKLRLIDIVKVLKDLDYIDSVDNINQLPQPSFFKISFDSVSMVEIFIDTVSHIEGQPIKILDSNNMPHTCIISVSNLPPDIIERLLLPQLRAWGECTRCVYQYIPKNNGGRIQIGMTKIHFKFLDGYSLHDIPYFLRILGFKIFLHIQGRQRICFRCSSTEHLVSLCPLKYCSVCRSLKGVPHQCSLSYAAAASSSIASSLIPAQHDQLLVEMESSAFPQADDSLSDLSLSEVSGNRSIASDVVGDLSVVSDPIPDAPVQASKSSSSKGDSSSQRMRTRSLSSHGRRLSFLKSRDIDARGGFTGGNDSNKRKSTNIPSSGKKSKDKDRSSVKSSSGGQNRNGNKSKPNKEKPCKPVGDIAPDGIRVQSLSAVESSESHIQS